MLIFTQSCRARRWFLPVLLVAVMDVQAGDDWTEYLAGPGRAGVSGVTLAIPSNWKPEILWRREIGSGYSGVLVVSDRLITAFSDDGQDWLGAFQASSGASIWRSPLEPTYQGHDGSKDGPLATPAASGDRVFGLSARGKLVAFSLKDGKEVWRRDLVEELGIPVPYFGFASSPTVEDGKVIVLAGGGDGKCLLAFERATGKLAWSSQSDGVDYASATAVTLSGVRQIVALTEDGVFAVAPADGKLLWRLARKPDGWATPLALGEDRLLIPMDDALIAVRCREADGAWSVETLWELPEFSPYGSFFATRGFHVFGTSKDATLCVDWRSGKIAWSKESRESSAVLVGDTLFRLDRRSGRLAAVAAAPDAYRELATAAVFEKGQHYTPPSFARGRLYVRSLDRLAAIRIEVRDFPSKH